MLWEGGKDWKWLLVQGIWREGGGEEGGGGQHFVHTFRDKEGGEGAMSGG